MSVVPESITDRELLTNLIKESVGYLNKIDEIKFQLKEVKDVATDKDGKLALDSAAFNSLVQAAYNANAIKTKISKLQNSLDDLSVLKGEGEVKEDGDE